MFELEDKYPLFANFYAKVIAPSVKEINEHTDLLVTKAEQIKEGKKTQAIRFECRLMPTGAVLTASADICDDVNSALANPGASDSWTVARLHRDFEAAIPI